jgi:hypothetical protein
VRAFPGLSSGTLRRIAAVALGAAATLLPGAVAAQDAPASPLVHRGPTTPDVSTVGPLPLSFEENRGQTDSRVSFLARGRGYVAFLSPTEAVLKLRAPKARAGDLASTAAGTPAASEAAVLRIRLHGASEAPRMSGLDPRPGRSNYFIGRDPTRWRTDVPRYGKVRAAGVYPGVDVVYYGEGRRLAFDFIVAPGADPGRIALDFDGADALEIDASGDLVVRGPADGLRQRRPVLYQEIDGVRTPVDGRYVLKGPQRVAFEVGAYDATRPLVIDPSLIYSTYLGGSGLDAANGIALDGAGRAYVTGFTDSVDFPVTDGVEIPGFLTSAFVAKLTADGSDVDYSTFLGGSWYDQGNAVAVDAQGNAYVVGLSLSEDFPTSPGAVQELFGGFGDVFVVKLGPNGNFFFYSTYLGGANLDQSGAIAIDAAGNAYVAGLANAPDFPPTPGSSILSSVPAAEASRIASAARTLERLAAAEHAPDALAGGDALIPGQSFPTTPGAFQRTDRGDAGDGFVAKINPTGTALVYSTLVGGSALDGFIAVAIDGAGNAYAAGGTLSADYPTTPGAFQRTLGGNFDGVVTKVNPTGTGLVYSTYLGGANIDAAAAIKVDAQGNAYVTGGTISTNFPVVTPIQPPPAEGLKKKTVFVTKINPSGTGLVYSTLLGGTGGDVILTPELGPEPDQGLGIAIDAAGNAYITGLTGSIDLPTTRGAFQTAFQGGVFDAFVMKLDASGTSVLYSSYLGGSDRDQGSGIAVDAAGRIYVAGVSRSFDFPTTVFAFQDFNAGNYDAFVLKLDPSADVVPLQFVQFPETFPSLPPTAQVGLPYQGNIGIGGGAPPFTVRLVEGALPAGLRFGSPVITGTPTAPGPARFTVEVEDRTAILRRTFDIVVGVAQSALDQFVGGFYQTILGRAASPSETSAWTGYLLANPTPAGAAGFSHTFLDGAEYLATPVTHTSFVTVLYRVFLGREPDAPGLAGWAGLLQDNFDSVLPGFVGSPEFSSLLPSRQNRPAVEAVVRRLYQQVLGRSAPAASEVAGWTDYIVATGDVLGVARGFFRSEEYNASSRTLLQHVGVLYRTFLGREPALSEATPWQNLLLSYRVAIEDQFIASAEFQGHFRALFP